MQCGVEARVSIDAWVGEMRAHGRESDDGPEGSRVAEFFRAWARPSFPDLGPAHPHSANRYHIKSSLKVVLVD